MRIYYGDMGEYSVLFNAYETVDTGQSWCSPCIADADGDGVNELYAGTFEDISRSLKIMFLTVILKAMKAIIRVIII